MPIRKLNKIRSKHPSPWFSNFIITHISVEVFFWFYKIFLKQLSVFPILVNRCALENKDSDSSNELTNSFLQHLQVPSQNLEKCFLLESLNSGLDPPQPAQNIKQNANVRFLCFHKDLAAWKGIIIVWHNNCPFFWPENLPKVRSKISPKSPPWNACPFHFPI